MEYRTLDPARGELLERFPNATDADLEAGLSRAAEASEAWRRTDFADRARILRAVADVLERRAGEWAALMAREMGKPLKEGEGEARKCAWACRFYAQHGQLMLAPMLNESDGSEAFVRYDPLGPILAVMPWNFPFWQFFRFAAPALMAGNVAILKHAPNTPGCARAIGRILEEAGLPDGVVQVLFLTHEQAARAIADARVRGVTLTGSTRAGSEIAANAGRHLKPMVMELGGSDAFVVLSDADVADAAAVGVRARCMNGGQSCIAAKRFIVERSVYDEFLHAFIEGMRARVPGDPRGEGVDLGPLAREDLRDALGDQVRRSVAAGARVAYEGTVPDRGFFHPPTVLVDVDGTPAMEEELFGPVAAVTAVDGEDEAIERANATRYGLGASVWTRDLDRARALATRLEVGSVFVNGQVKSDPRLPFGGTKDSGFGRELGREGILEFVNAKTVWIA